MRLSATLVPRCLAVIVPLVLVLGAVGSGLSSPAPVRQEDRSLLQKTMQDGNYREAYEGFRALALSADTDPRMVGNDLQSAVQCLQHLNEDGARLLRLHPCQPAGRGAA